MPEVCVNRCKTWLYKVLYDVPHGLHVGVHQCCKMTKKVYSGDCRQRSVHCGSLGQTVLQSLRITENLLH